MSGAILIDTFSITIKSVLKDSKVDKNMSFKVLRFRKEQKMKTFIIPIFFLSFFYLADGEYALKVEIESNTSVRLSIGPPLKPVKNLPFFQLKYFFL